MLRCNDPCSICEQYILEMQCEQDGCPVRKMKEENKQLKAENARLRLEMSYMQSPNTIGDSHEMGAW